MSNSPDSNSGFEGEEPLPQIDQILEPRSFDWLSAGQFALSLISALILLGGFLIGNLVLAAGALVDTGPELISQDVPSRNFLAGLGFAGLLMVPSLVHSGRRLFTKKEPRQIGWNYLAWVSVVLPVPFIIGYLIQVGPLWTQRFLPLVHILANGLGILWVIYLVRRKLPKDSAQRVWGSFISGISMVPPVTVVIELVLLGLVGIAWVFIMQSSPEYTSDLQTLSQLIEATPGDLEIPMDWAEGFVTRPAVVATILIYIAVLIPLVEEFLKPMVLWFVLHLKLHPREGFLIGATAGAGYAMFENLTIGASLNDWVFITISRLGTAAVHVLATGLVGWGLVSAATEKKYFRMIGAYLVAVSLHAVWNGLNIITALGELPTFQTRVQPFTAAFSFFAPVGLILLAFGSVMGLIRANNLFRRAIIAQDSDK